MFSYASHLCHVRSADPLSYDFYSSSQMFLTILENAIEFRTLKIVQLHSF